MKYIVLILSIITLTSCVNNNRVRNISDRNRGFIVCDTLVIKGVPHEFILSRVYGGCCIVHSPECPCLKNRED